MVLAHRPGVGVDLIAIFIDLFLRSYARMKQHKFPRLGMLGFFHAPYERNIATRPDLANDVDRIGNIIADIILNAEEAFDQRDRIFTQHMTTLAHLVQRQIVPRKPVA